MTHAFVSRCFDDPDIAGIDSTSSECEDTLHGSECVFSCEDGLRPSGTTVCTAGEYAAATCDEIDACANHPCPLPDSETCTDVLAADGGLDAPSGRTCAGNPCTALDETSLANQGYTAVAASATTVNGLGEIGCAAGYMRAGDRSVAPTATCSTSDGGVTPGSFVFAGCVPSECSGIPDFLQGFDTTGVVLPRYPADPAVGGLDTCLPNRLSTPFFGGHQALEVSCNSDGDYEQVNPVADDKQCAPCTAVEHAAVEACTYAIPDVPPVGTALPSAEEIAAGIQLCAGVDVSSSNAAADQIACESAGGGSICEYSAEAVYNCTTETDSRVSACKPGYYKIAGSPDVAETANAVESTNDVCTPCVFVEHAAHGSILSCNTALDARVSGCAAEYYRKPGVAERCEGPNATDTACSTAVLDGTASTCTAAATTTSGDCVHTASTPETCNAVRAHLWCSLSVS